MQKKILIDFTQAPCTQLAYVYIQKKKKKLAFYENNILKKKLNVNC